jgi:hypothetical protein
VGPELLPAGVAVAAFEQTPWIGRLLGWIVAVVLLIAIFAWLVFGLIDLHRRSDIGGAAKTAWLAAFVLSAGVVLVVYGAVRFSSTNGEPGLR